MIFWFTGQPGSGKSTLVTALASALSAHGHRVVTLDGEDLRRQTNNTDYSESGRIQNVKAGQQRATELDVDGTIVLASFVSPHRKLRDEFKRRHARVLEIYLHTNTASFKDRFRVPYYEPPLTQYMDMDTSSLTVEECVRAILDTFENRKT